MKRRTFFQSATLGGMAAAMAPIASCSNGTGNAQEVSERYRVLDAVLQQPVFKKELFTDPVVIASVELLRMENSYLCRVRSTDGAEGISVAHNDMRYLVSFECPTSQLKVEDGKITVPTGPGLGIEIDPDFIDRHVRVQS